MSILVKSTPAPKPKSKDVQKVAYLYAAILLIFVLCQLFTFDDFLILIDSFWLPGGSNTTSILGGLIVTFEVFAIPFLLGMRLSPLARIISMALGWLVPFIWLLLSLWMNLTINHISNVGFLGSLVDIVPGWWTVFICFALGILSAWASWGMWPFKSKTKLKK